MPSNARQELANRLADTTELIATHVHLVGGTPGRPSRTIERKAAAVVRAGVVLLAASTEAFVEDLFEEAAALVFSSASADELKDLFKQTSKRLNNASTHKVDMLYFNLGFPWVTARVRWQKFSNASFKKSLNKLVETRNQIAHGKQPRVTLPQLRKWKTMVEMFDQVFEREIADLIKNATGTRPGW